MITERLINLRKETNSRRQADVAKALKISTSTYSTYEQGTREADHTMLIKIAHYYGVSIDYLLDLDAPRLPLTANNLNEQLSAIQSQLTDSQQSANYLGKTLDGRDRQILLAALKGVNLVANSILDNPQTKH